MKSIEITKKNKKRKVLLLRDEEKEVRKEIKDQLAQYNIIAPNVYSFVKGKSSKMAVEKIKKNIKYYNYFIKADISNYYECINVERLNEILRKNVKDIILIEKIMNLIDEERKTMDISGLAIGSPLSNILGNIYLSEIDYKYLNRNVLYIRFCDDIFMLSNNKEVFSELREDIEKLELSLNNKKTIEGKSSDKVKFLGNYINAESKISFEEIIKNYSNLNYRDKEHILNSKNMSESEKYVYKILVLGESYEDIVDNLIEKHKYSTIEEINKLKERYDTRELLVNKLLDIFSICDKGYYVSDVKGIKDYRYIDNIMDSSIIRKHINGEVSLAVSLLREDGKSNMAVIDIDDKNADINAIEDGLKSNKLFYYKEYSGMKGFHYWLFFDRFYNVKDINKMINRIKEKNFKDIPIEIIPKHNYLDTAETIIKVPYGIHPISNKRSEFILGNFEEEIQLNTLKISEEAFENFLSEFYIKFPVCKKLLDGCSCIKEIIKEGIIDREMSHYKRLILLYVIKFLDNGEEILHSIFENMDNYSFNITEKNINKAFNNPISCEKIRNYIKNGSGRIKCLCSDSVACPLIKVDDKRYNGMLYREEMKNIIEKIIKLKNEKKSIERNITILQNKLEKIFKLNDSEEVNVELGKLKKRDNKWIIEMEI